MSQVVICCLILVDVEICIRSYAVLITRLKAKHIKQSQETQVVDISILYPLTPQTTLHSVQMIYSDCKHICMLYI